ncbi:hypothetical protein BDR22DRAFT_401721 [Usnea florida]
MDGLHESLSRLHYHRYLQPGICRLSLRDRLMAIMIYSRGSTVHAKKHWCRCCGGEMRMPHDPMGPFPGCISDPRYGNGQCANCLFANHTCELTEAVVSKVDKRGKSYKNYEYSSRPSPTHLLPLHAQDAAAATTRPPTEPPPVYSDPPQAYSLETPADSFPLPADSLRPPTNSPHPLHNQHTAAATTSLPAEPPPEYTTHHRYIA